jgi:Leucine-rich repeat (LRR) protein
MLKQFFILLIGVGLYTTTIAQCDYMNVYKTARKGGNAIYLRDFNRKLNVKGSDSTIVNLNKGTLYRFIHYNSITSYFELRDNNNRLIRSSLALNSEFPVFDFLSPDSSTYKLIFYNKTDQKICSVIVLAFVGRKMDSFISITSDSSLLATGKHLDLSHQYTDTFSNLSAFTKFTEVLDISFNNFRELPSEISNFEYLKKLSLSGNSYLDVDQAVKNIPFPEKIEVLDLSSLHIQQYPADLNSFSNLKALSFSDSYINSTSGIKNVFLLESLETLSLKSCRIKKLTVPEVSNSSLKKLDLSGNYLKYNQIKNILKNLPKLKTLCLSKRDLRESQLKRLQKSFPNLEIIHCSTI